MRVIIAVLSVLVLLVSSFNIAISLGKEEIQETNISNYEESEKHEEKEDEHEVSEYVEGEKPLYIDGILVVNKDYCIPKDYKSEKEGESLEAFAKMKEAAKEDGIILNIRSGHRSYHTQVSLFNKYAKRDGIEAANTYSAKPGFSEHQTGLAYDFTGRNTNRVPGIWFDNTPEAKWLYENAHEYGFILRYPKNKEHITGYIYESWHYRYIGTEHSKNFNMNDLTLEEYLGLYKN